MTQIKSFTTKLTKLHKGKPILFVLPLIYRFSLPAPNAGTRVFSFVPFVAEALNKVINRANLKK
jgi:hypothetical protein